MTPLFVFTLFVSTHLGINGESTQHCQPGESCWPTSDQVEAFSATLSATDARFIVGSEILTDLSLGSCMGLPSLSYPGNEGKPVRNFWYQEAPDPITPYQLGKDREMTLYNVSGCFALR